MNPWIVLLSHLLAGGSGHAPAQTMEPCHQAPPGRARTASFDAGFSITGAGSRELPGGATQLVWTGESCSAWIRFKEPLQVNEDTGAVRAAAGGGEFLAVQDDGRGRLQYSVSGSAPPTFTVNGAPVPIGAQEDTWIRGMVRELIRRSGRDARTRARRLAVTGGIDALLAEAREIAPPHVRAQYLAEGFGHVPAGQQRQFVSAGARLLDNDDDLGQFLLSVPDAWLTSDAGMRDAIYTEALRVESDASVEQILHRFRPPQPMTAATRALIERLIGTIASVDRRLELLQAMTRGFSS